MAKEYLTKPELSAAMPRGVPYIVGNEAAERFSFYGMRGILVIFMTRYLLSPDGQKDVMTDEEAKSYFHLFVSSAYLFPILGAIISDCFLGKYRTILYISFVYCVGHLALAIDETRLGLAIGLTLIAIGSGGIKPCVSAHVGDQFGKKNEHLLPRVFAWFYFSINVGAFTSSLATPWLLDRYGPSVAFGTPGVFMLLATIVFWMGRHRFVHIPPGGKKAIAETFSRDGIRAILNLSVLYVFVAVFWSIFDQTGSAWVLQARQMDRQFLGIDWLPSQIQAANPILVLILIPLFSYGLYPAINRLFELTPLRKIAIGFFLAIGAFALPSWVEIQITGGQIVKTTSDHKAGKWASGFLLDGDPDKTGWVSAHEPKMPQEIVVRLRDRRAWTINSVRVSPNTAFADSLVAFAKDFEVLTGPAPDGPWTSVRKFSLEQSTGFQEFNFEPVSTEFVMIRVTSNWDGEYLAIGELEVMTTAPIPDDIDQFAADSWPNVAASGFRPSIAWQLVAYILMTAAEVMISITALEFSYTQAPRTMKSFIMGIYLASVALGNAFTALVNYVISNEDGTSKLEGASYYWFFTILMAATAVLFLFVMNFYRGQTYIQGDEKRPKEE